MKKKQNSQTLGLTEILEEPPNDKNILDLEDLRVGLVMGQRVGRICHVDKDAGTIYVDYDGNPSDHPLNARLGRPFMMKDIETAIDRVMDIRLEFENNDPLKPVITDVYYSVFDKPNDPSPMELSDIYIKGKRIILEGETEIVIKSGSVTSTYSARDGKLENRADEILSEAVCTNRVRGASIKLN